MRFVEKHTNSIKESDFSKWHLVLIHYEKTLPVSCAGEITKDTNAKYCGPAFELVHKCHAPMCVRIKVKKNNKIEIALQ